MDSRRETSHRNADRTSDRHGIAIAFQSYSESGLLCFRVHVLSPCRGYNLRGSFCSFLGKRWRRKVELVGFLVAICGCTDRAILMNAPLVL
ncbi:hypothetical protein ACH5RR_017325 [Cinchona calisaya]|uniref:Uncharacterized protein n=1 Tax=Cinchona calisaya TaxID=153742 RepID=A0ABD2ZYF1_9GENT